MDEHQQCPDGTFYRGGVSSLQVLTDSPSSDSMADSSLLFFNWSVSSLGVDKSACGNPPSDPDLV